MSLDLPYKFIPRPYQSEFFATVYDYSQALPVMIRKRGVIVRPRRHGKDKSIFNMVVIPEMIKRVGLYYYVFPEYAQARKAFRENIDNDGFRLLDHIPQKLIKNINHSEMKIELVNGSILRVVGTDKNIDGVIGSNPVGIIFSERALCNPTIRDLMRPMLLANGGWVFFVYTPRGKNHGRDMFDIATRFPDTRALAFKNAKETYDNNGVRVFSDEQLEEEKREGMDSDLFEQEYMCSFNGSMKGAIYSEQIKLAESENRITSLPIEIGLQVWTIWDLGMSDTTAIWFAQFYGKEIRIIDHYEMSGKGLEHFVDILNGKGYSYAGHCLPHDSRVKELGTGVSRIETLDKFGLKNIKVVPNIGVDQGIDVTRRLFKNMWFDKEKCDRGINAIKSYIFEYDDKNKMRSKTPKHNRASHSADALRYLGVMYNDITTVPRPQQTIVVNRAERYL